MSRVQSKTELLLLQTHLEPQEAKREQDHQQFTKEITTMIVSLRSQFLVNTQKILSENKDIRIRPPHSPNFFNCKFPDCIYCQLRESMEDHLKLMNKSLTAHVTTSAEKQQQTRIFPRKKKQDKINLD
ncbi:hypothetical protein RFI_14469 [Reticulomyxa filosa]|uniref:Uncharacterized protein n=1 Tax=Reticulomyxa filosa TaxID=46433 RepID=X6NAD1_RETFI|nr:hypothetical protein RFI_14469 [Reticulomyxa filosa]|eukprot:ETO22724.1 hypothetical protein RFI_14469 [Reticulomyxa filosa]